MSKNKYSNIGKKQIIGVISQLIHKIESIEMTLNIFIEFMDKENNFQEFMKNRNNGRIILMTTKAKTKYHNFKFNNNDTILFGRESAGVPEKIHKLVDNRIKIPLKSGKRSLNIASSVAIVLAESMRQNKII